MTRLVLVRHGETAWNAERRHQGQTDISLNERGRAQARSVAARLAAETFDAVYASDLGRAAQTAAAIVAGRSHSIVREPRLREMHFGEWEGLTYEEIQQRKAMTSDDWAQTLMESGPPGGENLPGFAARVGEVLEEVLATHQNGNVLIVGHSGSLRLAICLLLGHPIEKNWQFRLDRASVSEISVYPEGAILNLFNDTCHLEAVTWAD